MQITKGKTAVYLIALFLMLTIAVSIIVLPTNAQTVQYYPSFAFVAVAPDPVGVGQPVTIVVWTAEMPPQTPTDYLLGSAGNRAAWIDWTITVTKPDGSKQTFELPVTDPVGGTYYVYTPDTTGNYSVQSHFAAQWKNTTTYNRLYAADDSDIAIFTVQDEQLQGLPGAPLPTEYWTRPIYAYNREWSKIAGNWITGSQDDPYITAPNTAHIMWTEPYYFGGIGGGAHQGLSYHTGSAYEGKFGGVTIISGWLFYNLNLADSTTTTKANIIARDLRTGKLIWQTNQSAIGSSSIYEYDSPNQHGLHPYLWTSGSAALTLSPGAAVPSNTVVDPFQGTELFTYTDVPSGTATVGPKGERYVYVWGGPSSNRTWLALWDSFYSPALTGLSSSRWQQYLDNPAAFVEETSFWQWRPVGKSINGTMCYKWNITLPAGLGTSYQVYTFDDRIISGTGFNQFGTSQPSENFVVWCISLKEGQRGTQMWKIAPKPPATNVTLQWSSASVDEGVLILRAKETRQWIGFDIDTGTQLWITDPEPQWMMYSSGVEIRDGKFYSGGYGGQVFAYNVTTGDLLWSAAVDNEGLESAYDRSPLSIQVFDGKVFARSQEHSHTHPLYRTWKVYCFDAETGDRVWTLNGLWSAFAFSDGYGVSLNADDNQIYCVGKGPSATSVTASPKVSVNGNSVLVEGSVTDISAGAKSDALTARFPNGVPAISDEYMSPWMEYVYMQMPKPIVEGVEVVVSVLDPNNNAYEVGRTTSDEDGMFKLAFEPLVPGEYTIIASFEGSDSYWPSHAKTAINVEEAPAATAEPTPTPASVADLYFLPVSIGTIVAVIAVGLLLFLLLRKR